MRSTNILNNNKLHMTINNMKYINYNNFNNVIFINYNRIKKDLKYNKENMNKCFDIPKNNYNINISNINILIII